MYPKTARRIAIAAGLGSLVVTGVLAVVFRDEIALRWHVHKLRYGSGPERDEAFAKVVAFQRYRGKPPAADHAEEAESVSRVVECPQPGGGVVLAVFTVLAWSNPELPSFTLIDTDGTIIPTYLGWNSMNPADLKDINADGTLEQVARLKLSWDNSSDSVPVLVVLPMTRAQRPSLVVVYNYQERGFKRDWRLVPTASSNVLDIEMGPLYADEGGGFKAEAVFRWSPSAGTYVGPEGGKDQPFLRVNDVDEGWQLLEDPPVLDPPARE